jgi:hypothetical protein
MIAFLYLTAAKRNITDRKYADYKVYLTLFRLNNILYWNLELINATNLHIVFVLYHNVMFLT